MITDPKKRAAVEWRSSQGTVEGKVEQKLTGPTDIKVKRVAATADDPQYLVKSDRTGAEAAHRPETPTKNKDRA